MSIAQDRSNLDAIKTLVLGLRSTGNFDTELTQGWSLRKISRHRVQESFIWLKKDFPGFNFTIDNLLEAVESSIYTDDVIEMRAVSVNKNPTEPGTTSDEPSTKVTTLSDCACPAAPVPSAKASGSSTGLKESRSFDCLFCSKKHASTDCQEYNTFEKRKTHLVELGRCTCCLSPQHLADSCPNKARTCHCCSRMGHSTPLCWRKIKEASSSALKTTTKRKSNAPCNKTSKKPAGTESGNTGMYLETFYTTVVVNGQSARVRRLLDGGSNASYIHVNLLNRLHVIPSRETLLEVQSYGTTEPVYSPAGRVEVTFIGMHGSKKTCMLFSSGCIIGHSTLSPPPKEVAFTLPMGLSYADPDLFSSQKREIEVLIGNDL